MAQGCLELSGKIEIFRQNGKFTICGLLKLTVGWGGGFANKNRQFGNRKPEFCHMAGVLFREFAFFKFANPNKIVVNRNSHLVYCSENQKNDYAYV